MNVTMVLADVVRVEGGKLDALGIGWNVRPLGSPWALGLSVEVPFAEIDAEHHFEVVLTDDHGSIVVDPDGAPLFRVEGTFRGQKQPGVLLGTPGIFPIPLPLPEIPLTPGDRYRFVLAMDGRSQPEWERSFTVVAGPMANRR